MLLLSLPKEGTIFICSNSIEYYVRNMINEDIASRLRGLYDSQCVKLAGIVGTGIHLYSLAINNSHFKGIYDDFTNGEYLKGALKATVPILLPYCVSLYSRKKAKREVQEKIKGLEQTIVRLENVSNKSDL